MPEASLVLVVRHQDVGAVGSSDPTHADVELAMREHGPAQEQPVRSEAVDLGPCDFAISSPDLTTMHGFLRVAKAAGRTPFGAAATPDVAWARKGRLDSFMATPRRRRNQRREGFTRLISTEW